MKTLDRFFDNLSNRSAKILTRAHQLTTYYTPFTTESTNENVHEYFQNNPSVPIIAVVEDNKPIGLINRNFFMEQYARNFVRDLHGRRSCTSFMETDPLVVDHETSVESLFKTAIQFGEKTLKDGFITTENGLYKGLGTGFSILQAISDIEAEKTRQLLSSINYASLIQRSHLMESDRALKDRIADYGMLWEPRDIVGGDAYFFRETPFGFVGCLFDCTGHGVPGAFMTLITLSFLEQTFDECQTTVSPGDTLTRMNVYIKRVLQQRDLSDESDTEETKASNDGLDALLFFMPRDNPGQIQFASARLPLLVCTPGHPIEIHEGNREGIGYLDTPADTVFETQQLNLAAGSILTIPTDGIIDQLGGPKKIAFGKRRLAKFMDEQRHLPASEMLALFKDTFYAWQGTQRRRDDVSIFSFKTERQS